MNDAFNDDLNNNEVEDILTPSYSFNYEIDNDFPVININKKTYVITTKDKLELEQVTASDPTEGDLTSKIKSNINELDFTKEGIKKLEYSVSDSIGNTTYETVYITVKKDNSNIVRFGQVGIVFIVFIIFIFLNKYFRSLILERRFSRYTINSSKNKSISLLDNLYNQYILFIEKINNHLSKINFFNKLSKRYSKYDTSFEINSMNFISKKIVFGFLFIIFGIIVGLLQSKLIGILGMIISFIIAIFGFESLFSLSIIDNGILAIYLILMLFSKAFQ